MRLGTAAQWTASNAILRDGEYGFATDTEELKLGNGGLGWNTLPPVQDYILPSSSLAIKFDRARIYGTVAVPLVGNITLDAAALHEGVVQLIIHNDSVEPTYPIEFKKASGSGNYVTDSNNYIYAHCLEAATIIYTITQIP